MSVFSVRLKEARQRAGLSQEKLGLAIGLEESTASTRMNRYEKGVRAPDIELVQQIAKVLNVPAAYFYAEEDDIARLLVGIYRLPLQKRSEVVKFVDGMAS